MNVDAPPNKEKLFKVPIPAKQAPYFFRLEKPQKGWKPQYEENEGHIPNPKKVIESAFCPS